MKLRHTLSLALVITVTFASGASTAQVTEGVAAVVNDKVISTFDVRQRMRLMVLSTQVDPTEESMRRFQTQAIRALVDESLKVQEASKFEIVVSEAEIDQQITRLARQNDITADSVKQDLIKANISPHTLEDQMRADIAWQILVSGRYGSRIRVSNNQIALEQQRFKDNLSKPQYLVSEILLESPSIEQDPAIYAGGMSLIQQMKDGAPFVAVAQQFSAAPSAQQGGDMGWIREGDMPREVNAILKVMQVGTISNPIKVSGGFYIVAVRDRKDGSAPMMANFRQIVAPVADMDKMTDFLNDVTNCEGADNITDVIEGSFVNPFADVSIGDLAPAFREILESLQPNQWSKPVESPNGAVSILLCSKGYAEGSGVPTEDEIVNRITDQKLSMLSRRYLRDLRRDSTIEIRTP
ncbi:MAG: peptidylprolyl isomerase [Robiginitomaculum sp.]|nr:MAG: peptidylprolyl isomerase [Robiginitomaculum sp.]